jgi:RNA polymerase sigma-70 factor (ECF subfamily)
VLAVLYLLFNEGYLATGCDADPIRPGMMAESIRLTRILHELLPRDGEVTGLLAMMLLTHARSASRLSNGELVPLAEQSRASWDSQLIVEGHRLVRERLAAAAAGSAPGRYQILAAISAVHTSAPHVRDTDWSQILALYNELARIDPSPIVTLNRSIALAEVEGAGVALAGLDTQADVLDGYHAYHAARADLLRRLGLDQQSYAAYTRAIQLAGNTAEAAYLARCRDGLTAGGWKEDVAARA